MLSLRISFKWQFTITSTEHHASVSFGRIDQMTVVVVPKYDFPALCQSIFKHRISHLIDPFYQGAAPLSMDIHNRLCDVFPAAQIGQAYVGLTEMTVSLAMVSGSQKRGSLGSSGKLLPGIHARVLKPDGSLARYGERGELVVKGPGMALGYLHNSAATRETFIDGWVHTGDEVTMTDDQEVFVHDRLKVAPSELEDCLLSHPDVAEACVIGIPNNRSGEAPMALVVLTAAARELLTDGSMWKIESLHTNTYEAAFASSTRFRLETVA
ncbi:4-coumarate--CoA ligase-like 2 [Psilocybe cubensis]|uniref:4-coumarate--CoA ligase-like 2 n=1 Tax=Psilocybe cubensis TaxID=181762 RepID=A0ACB8GX14_PSICU|nr:4-coumarate--CoA ligase-like 2 [Psilocybe cubensis]KAH9480171.1 4-coumarate--CoA ligase-like 2 [Psilocybe cubensis]